MTKSQDKQLNNKLTATQKMAMTAGSVSALMLVPNSSVDADIVYVDDNTIFMSLGDDIGATAAWDVDGNGSIDFSLIRQGYTSSNGNSRGTGSGFYYNRTAAVLLASQTSGGEPLGGRGLVSPFGAASVQAMQYGFVVGPTLANYNWGDGSFSGFYARTAMFSSRYSFSNSESSGSGSNGPDIGFDFNNGGFQAGDIQANLMGFRFIGEDGELHYGWAEINFDLGSGFARGTPGTFTINRWAYQTVAGQGIAVGATAIPEPVSPLALLGLGAAGLLSFRRRKQKKSQDESA